MADANIISLVVSAVVLVVGVPVVVFAIEIAAGLVASLRPTQTATSRDPETRIAILVPAHNEGAGLRPTLSDAQAGLRDGDRLMVVADNCTDDTADEARQAGAEVVERHDPTRRGKGFALDFGIKALAADPPDVVIIVDADCRLEDGAVDILAAVARQTGRPAQALYLMRSPESAEVSHRVAEFAWRVKNHLRPAGLAWLGLPCQLMGTGMAFPFALIRGADLASGEIVEDMKLGLDLAADGHPPVFCEAATVSSMFPERAAGAKTQRQRWEGGHLTLIATLVPRLIAQAVRTRNGALLALVHDLAVPPLAFLVLCVVGLMLTNAVLALAGTAQLPLTISAVLCAVLAAAVFSAWLRVGRDVLPATSFAKILAYVVSKLGLYSGVIARRAGPQWVRTDRSSGP